MNLKALIAKRDALNREIDAIRTGRIAVGCTVKIKDTAKLPDGIFNKVPSCADSIYEGDYITFTVTKRAGNFVYVKDETGWNFDERSIKVKVSDVFGVEA